MTHNRWHQSDAALSIMRDNRISRQAHRALTLADRPGRYTARCRFLFCASSYHPMMRSFCINSLVLYDVIN
jgi:hypothetical protein